jgi:ferredoxin
MGDDTSHVRVTVWTPDGERTDVEAPRGATLRRVLLEAGVSPYTDVTDRLNCGGRGLCATCGVRLLSDDAPAPDHWHDRLADRFGYPRLSCQVTIEEPMIVRIPEKVVWGGRESAV